MTQCMVIESVRAGCLETVYRRFHPRGRMLSDGLGYIDSWRAADGSRGFQLMRTETPELFPVWTVYRDDLIEFEIGAGTGPE